MFHLTKSSNHLHSAVVLSTPMAATQGFSPVTYPPPSYYPGLSITPSNKDTTTAQQQLEHETDDSTVQNIEAKVKATDTATDTEKQGSAATTSRTRNKSYRGPFGAYVVVLLIILLIVIWMHEHHERTKR